MRRIDGNKVIDARRVCWRPEDDPQLRELQIIARAQVRMQVYLSISDEPMTVTRNAWLVASTATLNLGERFILVDEVTTGAALLIPAAEVL